MKNATQTTINIIVTLFILFRMSKCQKNKYFIGSSCGTQAPRSENKGFQQDLSKLMAARDAQDSQIVSVTTVSKEKAKAIVPFKGFRAADIDTVLEGDFMG